MFETDVGLDLGTATVLVHVRGRGIVVHEPSVVALDAETQQLLAVGQEALEMVGRTPQSVVTVHPLRGGVIAHYEVTERLLAYLFRRAVGSRAWRRLRVVGCVPSAVTDVERRAVVEACRHAGAQEVRLISEPMAAAIGAGLPVEEVRGHMVVDIGGGSTDVAVISMGQEVVAESVRVAGDAMDEALMRHLRKRHNLLVGARTAQDVKHRIGSADAQDAGLGGQEAEVRGQDAVSGLPRQVTVTAEEVAEALQEPLQAVVGAVQAALERTPPELAADVAQHGLVLTGGGALLRGIGRLLSRRTGLAVHLADDPVTCVARGAGLVAQVWGRRRAGSLTRLA